MANINSGANTGKGPQGGSSSSGSSPVDKQKEDTKQKAHDALNKGK